MTRALRKRHRRIFAVLGVVLPAAFITAIAGRRPPPTVPTLPPSLAVAASPFPALQWERADFFASSRIQIRLLRERAGSGRYAVAFSPLHDFLKPDLLVYWTDGAVTTRAQLPPNAQLLGEFDSSSPLSLPLNAAAGGSVILYSLADHEVVEVSKPIVFQ